MSAMHSNVLSLQYHIDDLIELLNPDVTMNFKI